MTDFTPDIVEMVLVAGIPAVLLYIFRISRRGIKGKEGMKKVVHTKTHAFPDPQRVEEGARATSPISK